MALQYWMRLAALLCSCVTFGLVANAGGLAGGVGGWCIFCWAFSFTGTLLIFLVEMFELTEYAKDTWVSLPVTFSSYGALLCLFASIIFPLKFLDDHQNYDVHNHLVATEVFSCLATLAYLLEVWISWKESRCYMTSAPGLLLVCQTYVAGIIFFFISNPVSYTDHAAERWCMAVYCICFLSSVASIISIVIGNLEQPSWLKYSNLCAAAMYCSATIIWPVFKYNIHYPSHIYPPESCQGGLGLCPWSRLVVVTALTVLNFLLYCISLCCTCTSDSANGPQYSTFSVTSTVKAHRPSQQTTKTQRPASDPSGRLLGDGRRNLHNYQSFNHPPLVVYKPNVVVCDAGKVNTIYVNT